MNQDGAIMMAREVVELRKEIANLKQQLHAYREYHDARDAWTLACTWSRDAKAERCNKAIAELTKIRSIK